MKKNSDSIKEPSVLESKSPKITPSRTATFPKVIHSLKGGTSVGSPSNRKTSVGNPTHRRTSSRIPSERRTNPREFPPIKPIEESGGSGSSGPPSSSASNSSNSLRKEKTVSSTSLEEQVQTSREVDENLKVPKNNSETLNSQVEDENKADKLKALEIVEEQYEEVLKNKTELESKFLELESKFKINLVKTESETAELKYKTDELELVKIRQKYNSLLEKIRVTEEKIQKIKLEINKKNREYAGELIFFPLINEIEKNNDEL
ncbi:hypothetical protein [Spiroplasma endosymbiont of Ammophila pubescens]|uniref:hypothetical protein n=1 Tax=Spiroplasma endosymbiont of Ammophila pubescens TaxID=3066315 RepID=UPI0032B16654